jgi:conjugative transfer region protein TrbK
MMTNRLERLPMAAAALIAALVVAACAIRLRGDESHTESRVSGPLGVKSDSTAAKVEQCRTVSSEQRDALLECKKIWAEKRRQFFGQSGSSPEATAQSSFPVPPKDESRLPSGYPFTPAQSE